MNIEELITQMQEIKIQYPSLEKSEILKLFEILAINDLTNKIKILERKL